MDKKLRFGELVRNSGRPQVVTLWIKPEKNPALTKAMKQNRVLTVVQEPGKTDYGVIGFELRPGASYLIFPRPLPRERNARVFGINYQLIEQPDLEPARSEPVAKPGAAPKLSSKQEAPKAPPEFKPPKPMIQKPITKKFKVKLRRTACVEKDLTVDAPNKKAAERQAVDLVEKEPFALDEAKVGLEVVKTE